MSVTYVRYGPRVFKMASEELPEWDILLFDPVAERSVSRLGDRYRQIDPAVRQSDLIVVRGSGSAFPARVEEDGQFRDLVGDSPLLILQGTASSEEPIQLIPASGYRTPESLPPLDGLRDIEIRSIIERSGACLRGFGRHFLLPSGWHASRFVRFADALRDAIDIVRIADWILPYLPEKAGILADTGGLLPLLLALQKQASSINREVILDTLEEYPEEPQLIRSVVDDLRARIPPDARIRFLVSVNASGRLVRALKDCGIPSQEILVVCDTGELPEDVVALSRMAVERWPLDSDGVCAGCESREATIIDPRTFERLPAAGYRWDPLEFREAKRDRSFWEMADRTDAVRLHVWVPYGEKRRHHSIYIDVPRILSDDEFRGVCIRELKRHTSQDLVVIPENPSAKALTHLIREARPELWKEKIAILDLKEPSQEVVNKLRVAEKILVVDDALVSGATLSGIRRMIYGITRQEAKPELTAFAVLARPRDEDDLRAAKRVYFSRVYWAAQVQLPRGENECSWCREQQYLSYNLPTLKDEEARDFARKRIAKLEEHELLPPFLLGTEEVEDERAMRTPGSLFGDLRPSAAYAAAASATQKVLNDMRESPPHLPIRFLDAKMVIDSYFDPVLLAGILRTSPLGAVRWRGRDDVVEDAIEVATSRVNEAILPGAIAELAWAGVMGKIPLKRLVAIIERLRYIPSGLKMMLELIEHQGTGKA